MGTEVERKEGRVCEGEGRGVERAREKCVRKGGERKGYIACKPICMLLLSGK